MGAVTWRGTRVRRLGAVLGLLLGAAAGITACGSSAATPAASGSTSSASAATGASTSSASETSSAGAAAPTGAARTSTAALGAAFDIEPTLTMQIGAPTQAARPADCVCEHADVPLQVFDVKYTNTGTEAQSLTDIAVYASSPAAPMQVQSITSDMPILPADPLTVQDPALEKRKPASGGDLASSIYLKPGESYSAKMAFDVRDAKFDLLVAHGGLSAPGKTARGEVRIPVEVSVQ